MIFEFIWVCWTARTIMHCNSERVYEPAGILSSTTFMFPQILDPILNSPENSSLYDYSRKMSKVWHLKTALANYINKILRCEIYWFRSHEVFLHFLHTLSTAATLLPCLHLQNILILLCISVRFDEYIMHKQTRVFEFR